MVLENRKCIVKHLVLNEEYNSFKNDDDKNMNENLIWKKIWIVEMY